MQPNTSVERSSLEKFISYSLAALAFFVLGYTAIRIFLNQLPIQEGVDTANPEIIIPHASTLWADFGSN